VILDRNGKKTTARKKAKEMFFWHGICWDTMGDEGLERITAKERVEFNRQTEKIDKQFRILLD